MKRWGLRVLFGLLAAVLLTYGGWNLYLAGEIAQYAASTTTAGTSRAEVAVVLGAAVWGEQPSPVFAERIHHAVALYRSGTVSKLFFTGGAEEDGGLAESLVARNYALARGVDARDMAWETESRTTFGNLLRTEEASVAHGWGVMLIVSDPLHMKRAMTMAEDLGLDVRPAPTPTSRYRSWWSRAGFLVRETFSLSAYLLWRWITGR